VPKVDIARNYAVAAFARWAHEGRPSYEDMEAGIEALLTRNTERREEQKTEPSKPTEAAILAAEREWERRRAYYQDMMAAEKVYHVFKDHGDDVYLEYVYLRDPQDVFKRGEISRRVVELGMILAFDNGLKQGKGKSPDAVYRRLKQANRLFCLERGISCGYFEDLFRV